MLKKILMCSLSLITANNVYSAEIKALAVSGGVAPSVDKTEGKEEEIVITNPSGQKSIKLPSTEILLERLNENNFMYFAEKTRIHKKLGGKELTPFWVSLTVAGALDTFEKYIKNTRISNLMYRQSDKLLKTILADSPEAIKELKEMGLIKD